MEEQKNKPEHIVSVQDPYRGTPPKWAAFTNASAKLLITAPLSVLAWGATDLGVDKVFRKIPFSENTLRRFTASLKGFSGIILGTIVGYGVYKEGKKAFKEAQTAESQHNQLAVENYLLRDQLNKLGQAPNTIISVEKRALPQSVVSEVSGVNKLGLEGAVNSVERTV